MWLALRSMAYGTWRFNAAFTRALQQFLSRAESTQFPALIPISSRSILYTIFFCPVQLCEDFGIWTHVNRRHEVLAYTHSFTCIAVFKWLSMIIKNTWYNEIQNSLRNWRHALLNTYTWWPCYALLWDSVVAWMRNFQCSRKLQFWHYYLWLFLQVALSHDPPLRVLLVHINDIRGITIHISYSKNHDSTLYFYYFYMSSLWTLAHIIAKGSSFSISSSFVITKLQKNCLDMSSTGSLSFPMPMDIHIHIPYHPYGDGNWTWI